MQQLSPPQVYIHTFLEHKQPKVTARKIECQPTDTKLNQGTEKEFKIKTNCEEKLIQ